MEKGRESRVDELENVKENYGAVEVISKVVVVRWTSSGSLERRKLTINFLVESHKVRRKTHDPPEQTRNRTPEIDLTVIHPSFHSELDVLCSKLFLRT